MDEAAKKVALRMIPYGLYVLTAHDGGGNMTGATVNWVTQASFKPPLVAVCIKADSGSHAFVERSQAFALSILGKGQGSLAYTFFKPVERAGQTLGGQPFETGVTGCPVLSAAAAAIECRVVGEVRRGDHTVFVGEMVDVRLQAEVVGRPDEKTLVLKDLGENVFYGG